MRGRMILVAALAAALILLAAACGGGDYSSEPAGGTTTESGEGSGDHGSKDVSAMSSVDVEMDDFYFEPTVLKGKPGQTLDVELENEGTDEHNFSIDDQRIDRDVEAGEKATVKVTFSQSGKLSFYCKYHRSEGMTGGLETIASAGY